MDGGADQIRVWKNPSDTQVGGIPADHPAGRPGIPHRRRGALRLSALVGLTVAGMAMQNLIGDPETTMTITGDPPRGSVAVTVTATLS